MKIYELAGGEIRLWIEQESSIHIRAVASSKDPVELTQDEARKLAQILLSLADQVDEFDSSGGAGSL